MKRPSPIVKSSWLGSSDFGCSNQSGPMGHISSAPFGSADFRDRFGIRDGCYRCGDQLFHLSDIIKRQFSGRPPP